MPTPKREKGEEAQKFMGRCMTSDVMKKEYPEQKQRVAVCTSQSRAGAAKSNLSAMVQDELVYAEYENECECGEVEELTESNFVVPEESDYEDFGEEVEEVSADGLWDNIRKKKKREGKDYKPAKPGDKDRPSKEAWKKAQDKKSDAENDKDDKKEDKLTEKQKKLPEAIQKSILDKKKKSKAEEKDFKPHDMYDPETGKAYKAKSYEEHIKYKKMGYTHEKPSESGYKSKKKKKS